MLSSWGWHEQRGTTQHTWGSSPLRDLSRCKQLWVTLPTFPPKSLMSLENHSDSIVSQRVY